MNVLTNLLNIVYYYYHVTSTKLILLRNNYTFPFPRNDSFLTIKDEIWECNKEDGGWTSVSVNSSKPFTDEDIYLN